MRDHIREERKMVLELLNILIIHGIKESFKMDTMKDKENIIGLMEEVILENGKIIKWMVKEY
jgi:hypothetical protein